VGIAGMTARMRQLGGSLQIRCKPKGTIVHAIVPIGAAQGAVPARQIAAE
jgi:signal transduction histidine kinase